MKSAIHKLLFKTHNFEPGTLRWTFNPTTQMITVVKNDTNPDLTDVFETGVYNYQVVESSDPNLCSEMIKLDNTDMGCLLIVDGRLHIDQTYIDSSTIQLMP